MADSTVVLIGSQIHFGKILPHSKAIADLTDSYVSGWQADISRLRNTQASWNTCNCFSQNGISFSYVNFNNSKELGKGFSLAVFAEPLLTYGRLRFSLRAGLGVSYLTRVYHADNNPRNLFFSSPWNGLLLAQASGRYPINHQWLLRLSTSYSHISNGGRRQPNKGMNFPALSVGLELAPGYQQLQPRVRKGIQDKSMRYYLGLSYNTRSIDESNGKPEERKMVIGFQGGFYKPIARMHAIGLGLEFSHDGALKELARLNSGIYDHRVVSGLVQHHFLFGRFDFSQSLGIYLYEKYLNPTAVFQRYAIHFRILENLQAGFSLKAHLYTAEQMDMRIGFVF
ncbi:MAG: acyloxyacyl hydrolase [Cyclobacteriaceae bacterium]